MSKFEEYFKDPCWFTDDTYVIGGWYSREDAAKRIAHETGIDIEPDELTRDRVRYGFPPQEVAEWEDLGSCWYSGASGKGSKEIWVLGK